MSIELSIRHAADSAASEIVESAHWAPPQAPLDMPAQVLERSHGSLRAGLVARLLLALAPRLRA